ncbi:chitin synthesis regulation, resistance to congo red-domain-containing protein [Durotheca rogersii]|uniref:chitin synthesis regulation, resistance to congo red-domain-containing protein n=1 Tax=Durotheca rogersii TaxID=419775 RepID=UPI00221EB99E|nr:chitin synthesis regulation, resistance to congo red-domain-containing protein [Durotheca rogersii]KAI5862144.1 chitin synthesis regulation, resistance to congo red-domain-containing protein [Durotheca rogersii]
MAPILDPGTTADLTKRYPCRDGEYLRQGRCYTAWSWYGRWIFAGIVIFLIIAVFVLWACVNSRRRRRQGLQPMYGTGWMAGSGPPGGNAYNNPQGYNPPQGYSHPPPAYGAPPGDSYPMQNQYTGTTFRANDGYYAHQEGVQAPQNVYKNNGEDYAPPAGPPPNR